MTGIWSALQLFAKANAAIGDSPTAADTLAAMYQVKDETLDGLIPPVTYTQGQPAPSRDCFFPYILKDGTFTAPLGGLKYQCDPPQS
jgi:branched-chain amino acid transport system substrate-binding protein